MLFTIEKSRAENIAAPRLQPTNCLCLCTYFGLTIQIMRVKRQRLRHPFRSICILLFCIPLFRYPLQMSVSFLPLNVAWDFRPPNFAVRFAHLSTSDLCFLYFPISRSPPSSVPCVALFFPSPTFS